MSNKSQTIPINKRVIYAGDVFNSLMAEKKWSATEAADFVKKFQMVDAVEVVHGRWKNMCFGEYFMCSECDFLTDWRLSKYCPNCGAKMDGDGNG